MEPWKTHVTAAQTDIQAAFIGLPEQVVGHLRNARENLDKAIEAAEEKEAPAKAEPVKGKTTVKGA